MRFFLVIVVVVLAVLFAVQNYSMVSLRFFVWHLDASLAVVIVACLAIGALVSALAFVPDMLRRRSTIRRLERRVRELETDADDVVAREPPDEAPLY